jgi:succinyl-diaminopimelate desuccinylase
LKYTYWQQETEKIKDTIIQKTQELLRIKSVLDEENATADAPLGKGIKEALDYMLELGKSDGFTVKNVENLAGHIEMGSGKEIVGILCHLDVVPEGDGWSSDPYGAEIRDGKIFARGAIDDKGPTMAAYMAMKLVKESGVKLSKRVRMILGTDEESNWRCVDTYFQKEEMPSLGFAPDADFPIIYAEKGIWDFYIIQNTEINKHESADIIVQSFSSGRRFNMVPDFAKAELETKDQECTITQAFEGFLQQHSLKGRAYVDRGTLILEVEGVSAHGMEPNNGINAGLFLSAFIASLNVNEKAKQFFAFVQKFLYQDSRGKSLGISYHDDITGDLTINVGTLHYNDKDGGKVGVNLRYPVTFEWENGKAKLEEVLKNEKMKMETISHSKPHHVDRNSFLIKTLSKVYEEQTGEKAKLISIGGGTYARSLEAGVAFGPLFPGREDVAHQKDEYMYIEDLIKATAIYAQAIYELAK